MMMTKFLASLIRKKSVTRLLSRLTTQCWSSQTLLWRLQSQKMPLWKPPSRFQLETSSSLSVALMWLRMRIVRPSNVWLRLPCLTPKLPRSRGSGTLRPPSFLVVSIRGMPHHSRSPTRRQVRPSKNLPITSQDNGGF